MGDSESMYENVGQKYSYIKNNTQKTLDNFFNIINN